MSRVLPILFNTDMVRAILDARKTVTRRVMKNQDYMADNKQPYRKGDILYVRETWNHFKCTYHTVNGKEHKEGYFYKASPELKNTLPEYVQFHWGEKWKPSIHMPKEAARIWLRVTDVRVERLSRMLELDFQKEGISPYKDDMTEKTEIEMEYEFQDLWNSTIKKSELMLYGWDADPWVFVYEFERCEKPKKI